MGCRSLCRTAGRRRRLAHGQLSPKRHLDLIAAAAAAAAASRGLAVVVSVLVPLVGGDGARTVKMIVVELLCRHCVRVIRCWHTDGCWCPSNGPRSHVHPCGLSRKGELGDRSPTSLVASRPRSILGSCYLHTRALGILENTHCTNGCARQTGIVLSAAGTSIGSQDQNVRTCWESKYRRAGRRRRRRSAWLDQW